MAWEKQIELGNRALVSGLFSDAHANYTKAIAEASSFVQGDSSWAEAHRGLAQAAMELRKFDEADNAARIALSTDEQFWGYDCAAVCHDCYILGEILRRQGRFALAKPYFERALAFFANEYGDRHEQSLQCLSSLVMLALQSNEHRGYAELHARAFAAYQVQHITGKWAIFIRLHEIVEEHEARGDTRNLEHLLATELNMLKQTLGPKHKEISGVLECHASVLKRSKRSLAAWQLDAKVNALQSSNIDSLFFAKSSDFAMPAERAIDAIQKILSCSTVTNVAHAPALLKNAWWQIDTKESAPLRITATLSFNDGSEISRLTTQQFAKTSGQSASDGGAQIELRISAAPRQSNSHVNFQWRLHNSHRQNMAKEIMQFLFTEVEQTLVLLPSSEVSDDGQYGGESGSDFPSTSGLGSSRITVGLAVRQATQPAWPTPQAYNEAVQNPAQCFFDHTLKSATPELNALGLPRPLSGAFATVYRLQNSDTSWAIKCFTERVSDHRMRYQAISTLLHPLNLPFLVDFDYQSEGVKVLNQPFPIVKMRWVDGQTLNVYVASKLRDKDSMTDLLKQLFLVINRLEELKVAHGDLQHGNILVRDGRVVLVDYDGMFVPQLAGHTSNELGHRNYQHPKRSAKHFGAYLDRFAAWVIYVSIFCARKDPSLWESLGAGDEALLFKREDFLNPQQSNTFRILGNHSDADIRNASNFLARMTTVDLEAIPPFAAVLSNAGTRANSG